MHKFWDVHTHRPSKSGVLNIEYGNIESLPNFNYQQMASISAHPWLCENFCFDKFYKSFEVLENRPDISLVAIGEVGLDRLKGPSIELQKRYFCQLVDFANRIKIPLVLHNVRALDDILSILKKKSFSSKCLFHDFNGNEIMAQRVIDNGHYLGIGRSVFRKNSKLFRILDGISLDNVLLETDDLDINIDDIYKELAEIKGLSIEELSKKIDQNFCNFFEDANKAR